MTNRRSDREIHNIHPAAPNRLVSDLHKANWNHRELARRLGINSAYVSRLVTHGIEPTDKTPNGQAIRVKLHLPRRRQTSPRAPRVAKPKWLRIVQNKIREMRRNTKHAVLEQWRKDEDK